MRRRSLNERYRLLLGLVLLLGMHGAASANTYDAGQGYPFPTLASVPWSSLKPGDIVNIHWQPQPYKEHILLSQSGTAAKHIVVRGIPDPNTGQLPVIDGDQAVEAPTIGYIGPVMQGLGVVMVSPRLGYTWGYIPSYIDIESLMVVNARSPLTYMNPAGAVKSYGLFTCAIYVERGQHITVRNCDLTASGLGFFVNSKYDDKALSGDILVEGNYIHHNGVVNNYGCHNCYTEANGIVYQYNHIGPVIAGSYGDAIKDRSAGTVLRYNWFESGLADCLDLIEAQSDYPYINTLPNYDKTWVYGNTFYNGPTGASWMITYGGFDSKYDSYRKGTLYFYNNTIINQQDKTGPNGRWRSHLFCFPYHWLMGQNSIETIDFRNNIFYNTSQTPGATPADFALVFTDNTANFSMGKNYVSPGVTPLYYSGSGNFAGNITGWNNQQFGDMNGINNPGFVDSQSLDFRLANTSVCIDQGTAQAAAVAGQYDPLYEFLLPSTVLPRPVLGSALDLGAYEDSGIAPAVPLLGISNVSMPEGNSGTHNMVFTVTLTSAATAPVKVNYMTTDGTAKAGKDYLLTQGILTIPVGLTSGTISVPILGNTLLEQDKTFTLNLSNLLNAAPINMQAVGTILNDDGPVGGGQGAPIITSFTPGAGPVGTTVTLTGSNFTGTTTVAIHDIQATFVVVNDTKITLTIPAGATTSKIKVVTPKGTTWTATTFVVN